MDESVGTGESDRTQNLRVIAKILFPDSVGNADAALKRLTERLIETCGGKPDRRTVEKFVNGRRCNAATYKAVFAVLETLSAGRIRRDLRHQIDDSPPAFAAALNGAQVQADGDGAEGSFQDVADALSRWEAANRGWFNGGRSRLRRYVGVHRLYSLRSSGDAVELQILTITSDKSGVRARLSRPDHPGHNHTGYEGVVIENEGFLMMLLQKEDEKEEQMAGCYILLQRGPVDAVYLPGIICKEALGSPCAYRILATPGAEGDQPELFGPSSSVYKALRPALVIPAGAGDGPPAWIDAEITKIHPLIGSL